MIEHNLTFTANCVRCKIDGDQLFSTSSIYFGEGDPEQEGHTWIFYRKTDDDWGVWIVPETQQHGLHDSTKECILSRSRLECLFNERGTTERGINTLTILYDISDESWRGLAHTAQRVFGAFTYFKLIN